MTEFFINLFRLLVVRILAIFGFTVVTYSGFSSVFGLFKNYIISSFTGLPVAALQLFEIAGFGSGLSWFLSALFFVVTNKILSKIVFGSHSPS